MCQPEIPALQRHRHYPHTATVLVVPICDKRLHRRYSRQPALLNRCYKGTTTLLAYAVGGEDWAWHDQIDLYVAFPVG